MMNTSSRGRLIAARIFVSSWPACADERHALLVLVRARRLADAHEVGVRIAVAGHRIRRRRVERAARALGDGARRSRRACRAWTAGSPNSARDSRRRRRGPRVRPRAATPRRPLCVQAHVSRGASATLADSGAEAALVDGDVGHRLRLSARRAVAPGSGAPPAARIAARQSLRRRRTHRLPRATCRTHHPSRSCARPASRRRAAASASSTLSESSTSSARPARAAARDSGAALSSVHRATSSTRSRIASATSRLVSSGSSLGLSASARAAA